MLQEFITQNYLIIEQNIVTNIVLWNGDTTQWTPPQGSIALIQSDILAKIWILDMSVSPSVYILQEKLGAGGIGFTWDGTVLTTNDPQPEPPKPNPNQPTTTGTTTI